MIRPLQFQDVDFMPHTEHLGLGEGRVKNINLPHVVIRHPMLFYFSLR